MDIQERIRRLLALATHPTTNPHEAEVAMQQAMKLMAKYDLDEAEALVRGECAREEITSKTIDLNVPYASRRGMLYQAIADVYSCYGYIEEWGRGSKLKKKRFIVLVGTPSDIAKVEMLYASLEMQMWREMENDPYSRIYTGRRLYAWRNSFMLGFTNIVRSRLAEALSDAKNEGNYSVGAGLVLADKRAQAERWAKERIPGIKTYRVHSSGQGYGKGVDAGLRADLGISPRVSGAAKALER